MKRIGRLLLYGFVTWFVGLAVSMAVFPLRKSGDPLFETVMTLTVTSLAVLATMVHFRRVRRFYAMEGIALGAALLLVNLVLDLPLFLFGPLARPLTSYLGDIGLTYLVYPIVTVGSSIMLSTGVARGRAQALASADESMLADGESPSQVEGPAAAGAGGNEAAPQLPVG